MPEALAVDEYAEKAVLGALMLLGDARHVAAMTTRGLRPEHFYWERYGTIFTAAVSLCDRQAAIDPITLSAELDRLGLREKVSREQVEELVAYVPAAGHYGEYADRVIELARWRRRDRALHTMREAVQRRDSEAWSRASADLDSATAGTRTESYSPEQWGAALFDHFSMSPEETAKLSIPVPFSRLNDAIGGGFLPGELIAISGATSHGKSIWGDMCLDQAAKYGKKCHLYVTEMTAISRGMRYISRRTGIPYMRQRRNNLSDEDRRKILAELGRLDYGCTVAADWDVDDIVRDALRARYDLVVVDLLHGFHYEDERGLDRLSKAMQRLARVSTTLDGHPGTVVLAITHLKEEGLRSGKVPRPTITSIKGGSSIKQDADAVMFVWQEQDEAAAPTGDGEIWVAKGRSQELQRVDVRLNPARFRFDLRAGDELEAVAPKPDAPF